LAVAQQTEDTWMIAFAYFCRGTMLWQFGDTEGAIDSCRSAVDGFERCRDRMLLTYVKNSLAHLIRKAGDPKEASRYYLENIGRRAAVCGPTSVRSGCVLGACGVAFASETTLAPRSFTARR